MAKIKMHKDVKAVLRSKISAFKLDEGLTWKIMQTFSIKEKYKFPCEWQTLHSIANKNGAHPNTVAKVLEYFNVPHKKISLLVTLDKTEEQCEQ